MLQSCVTSLACLICRQPREVGIHQGTERLREVTWAVQGRRARKLQSQDVNPGHLTEKSCSLPHHILCISSLVRGEARYCA